jgi:hypothetical protein
MSRKDEKFLIEKMIMFIFNFRNRTNTYQKYLFLYFWYLLETLDFAENYSFMDNKSDTLLKQHIMIYSFLKKRIFLLIHTIVDSLELLYLMFFKLKKLFLCKVVYLVIIECRVIKY